MRMITLSAPALVAGAFLLTGCGGEPSAGAIRDAVAAKQESLAPLLGMMGAKVEVTDFKKHKCTAIEGGRFRCSYTVTIKAGGPISGVNEVTQSQSAVFEDIGGSWAITGQ